MAKVYGLLPAQSKHQALGVLALMFVNGLLELSGVAGVLPLVAAGVNPTAPQEYPFLAQLREYSGLDAQTFFAVLGLGFIFLMVTLNATSAFTLWLSCKFAFQVRHLLSLELLSRYLGQSHSWFLAKNTAELTKDVLNEIDDVVNNLIFQLVELLLSGTVAFLIAGALLFVNPAVALGTVVGVGVVYTLVYGIYRRQSSALGRRRTTLAGDRFRLVSESLNAVKEARAGSRRQGFLARYEQTSREFRDILTRHRLVSDLPRYVAETLAIVAIVGLLVYLTTYQQRSFLDAVPLMALYIMATWRLVPAVQGVYHNVIKIRFYSPTLEHLLERFQECRALVDPPALPLKEEIRLEQVSFSYAGTVNQVLRQIDLRIGKNTSIALTGRSGQGKSTLAALIGGLLEPTEGSLKIDGRPLRGELYRAWQQSVGGVPQSIFLTEDTIARNIALGVPAEELDAEWLARAVETAHLREFLDTLPEGIDTVLGERGITVSGGQQQRIGIARAVYSGQEVLIFDEATNALDQVTERAVLQAVEALRGSKTLIIIAHRLSTIRSCDQICLLKDGRVEALGKFEELLEQSQEFRYLAQELEEQPK